jgi:DNA-nicking Smr family endonuclease
MNAPAPKPPKDTKDVKVTKGRPLRDLKDLKAVKREIDARARQEQALAAARLATAARLKAEKELFAHTIGPVKALALKHLPGHRARVQRALPAPIPAQTQRDEQAVMQEAISDDFDAETLLDTDESLSFRRPGMGPDVVRKLRRGNWSIQRQLDLHGFRREDAREALGAFIREANKAGVRCVRVVHGKGLGSPGKTPVLKGRVQGWLIQKQEVLAFVQARPAEGGAGALVVLLA